MNSFSISRFCLTAVFALFATALQAEMATRAIVTNWGGTGVTVIDPATGLKVADIETGSKPHGVDISPDGRAIYVSKAIFIFLKFYLIF